MSNIIVWYGKSAKYPTNSSLKDQKYGLHSEKIKSFEIQKNWCGLKNWNKLNYSCKKSKWFFFYESKTVWWTVNHSMTLMAGAKRRKPLVNNIKKTEQVIVISGAQRATVGFEYESVLGWMKGSIIFFWECFLLYSFQSFFLLLFNNY